MCEDGVWDFNLASRNRGRHSTPIQAINRIRYNQKNYSPRIAVLVIECKDLSLARNYSEIAALLSDYQGLDVDGVADSLKKHLTRISILEDSLDQLRRFTGTQEPRVVSCLVCSGIVPMQYAKIDALAKTHVGSIEDILAL